MSFKQKLALYLVSIKFSLLAMLSRKKAAAAAFDLFTTPQHRNRKELTPLFQQAEQINFSFQEFEIQGYRWNAGAPRTVLLLHGFESSIINFGQYVAPFIDRGFCVLGFDAPAHGRSSGKQVNVRVYMQFIEEIRERFGPVERFLGHSLGGLSLCLALEDQGYTEDTKMVLIAPATETSRAIDLYFRILRLPGSLRRPFDAFIEERGGHPPEWFSVARAVGQLQLPVLWVHDEDDDMTPLADVDPVRTKAYPHIEFMITKGLGHRRIYRDPLVMNKVVAFLAG